MPKRDYITEITDAFGDEISSKQALKLAKKIKNTQKIARIHDDFKTQLKNRLRNTHLIDSSDQETSWFAFLKIFGTLCSFVFISGMLVFVYNAKGIPQQSILQNTATQIYDEDFLNTQQDISVPINKIQNPSLQDQQETLLNTSLQQVLPESGDINIIQPQTIEQRQINQVELDDIIQEENSFPQEWGDFDLEQDSYSETSVNSSLFDDGNISAWESRFQDSKSLENIVLEYYIQEFIRICEENQGIVSWDQYECVFADGSICKRDNTWEYRSDRCEALYGRWSSNIWSEQDVDKNNLEEVIENQGQ